MTLKQSCNLQNYNFHFSLFLRLEWIVECILTLVFYAETNGKLWTTQYPHPLPYHFHNRTKTISPPHPISPTPPTPHYPSYHHPISLTPPTPLSLTPLPDIPSITPHWLGSTTNGTLRDDFLIGQWGKKFRLSGSLSQACLPASLGQTTLRTASLTVMALK